MQSDFFSRKLYKKYYAHASPSQSPILLESRVVDNKEQTKLIKWK